MLPPALLRLRVHSDERRIRLWIPLVLLWPFIALVVILGAPALILAAACYRHRGWGRPMLLTGPLVLYALTSLRGLRIDLDSGGKRVFIAID